MQCVIIVTDGVRNQRVEYGRIGKNWSKKYDTLKQTLFKPTNNFIATQQIKSHIFHMFVSFSWDIAIVLGQATQEKCEILRKEKHFLYDLMKK